MAGARKKAGEAKQKPAPQQPQPAQAGEEKMLKLIHMMFPDSREKAQTLQDGVTWLLAECDRAKRKATELEKAGNTTQGSNGAKMGNEVLAGIQRIEASLKNVKENLSFVLQRSGAAR